MGTCRKVRWVARLVGAIVGATTLLTSGLGLTYLGASTVRAASQHAGLPDIDLRPLARRSEIVAADGSLLSALFEEDRVPVTLDQVPAVLVDAVVAVEDSAFFRHQGVSVRGLVRAAKANVGGGGVDQGGSTITQQLVKNGILNADRSYDRKAKEAVLAFRMEREFSKRQILETYLNTVYFGQGAYGVQAAARRFFGKPLAEVGLADAALLAGMISSPQTYDPVRRREAAKARRSHALRRMVRHGVATQKDADTADQAPLATVVQRDEAQPIDHFTEEVRRLLLADERLGATPAERSALLLRGGVRVETTLDPVLQSQADQAVREKLPPSEFTAALVSIDPSDGAVRALVGGSNFDDAKFMALAPPPVVDFAPPDPLAWPPNNWIGTAPPVLPPGFVLPPHLVPPPPPVEVAPAPTPTNVAPPTPPSTTTTSPTTTTQRRRSKDDRHARTDEFTSRAVVVGDIGVALGFERADAPDTTSLSTRRTPCCTRCPA